MFYRMAKSAHCKDVDKAIKRTLQKHIAHLSPEERYTVAIDEINKMLYGYCHYRVVKDYLQVQLSLWEPQLKIVQYLLLKQDHQEFYQKVMEDKDVHPGVKQILKAIHEETGQERILKGLAYKTFCDFDEAASKILFKKLQTTLVNEAEFFLYTELSQRGIFSGF